MIQLLSYTTGSTLTYYAFLYSLLLNTFALCVDSDRKEEPPGEAILHYLEDLQPGQPGQPII